MDCWFIFADTGNAVAWYYDRDEARKALAEIAKEVRDEAHRYAIVHMADEGQPEDDAIFVKDLELQP
jgi:molybdopterin synthase catalytic subunit